MHIDILINVCGIPEICYAIQCEKAWKRGLVCMCFNLLMCDVGIHMHRDKLYKMNMLSVKWNWE